VEVEGVGKEKKENAYLDALENAVRRAAGIRLLSVFQELRSGSAKEAITSRQSFMLGMSEGLVTEIDTLERAKLLPGELTNEEPVYRCRLRVTVRDRGEPDEFFQLNLVLQPERKTFRNGEEVELRLSATRDCFVTVYNLGADNQLYKVYPAAEDQVPLVADEVKTVTGLRIGLLEGMDQASESIIAVATKEPFDLLSGGGRQNVTLRFEGNVQGQIRHVGEFTKLGRGLARLSEDRWVLKSLGYSIIR